MKIQVSFNYNSVPYKFTINEDDIDMSHYFGIWDFWVGENDNELKSRDYVNKDADTELIFEIIGVKVWIKEKQTDIITGKSINISVYNNVDENDYCTQITHEDIEVRYA